MPMVWNAGRRIALVRELQAPHTIDLNRRDRKPGLGVVPLNRLQKWNAVEDQGPGKIDGIDPAALAGPVHAGRAGSES
ncbi:MAG: hypothetical protein ACHQ0J_07820 [Candidatus Dormibacterales bacterium]